MRPMATKFALCLEYYESFEQMHQYFIRIKNNITENKCRSIFIHRSRIINGHNRMISFTHLIRIAPGQNEKRNKL